MKAFTVFIFFLCSLSFAQILAEKSDCKTTYTDSENQQKLQGAFKILHGVDLNSKLVCTISGPAYYIDEEKNSVDRFRDTTLSFIFSRGHVESEILFEHVDQSYCLSHENLPISIPQTDINETSFKNVQANFSLDLVEAYNIRHQFICNVKCDTSGVECWSKSGDLRLSCVEYDSIPTEDRNQLEEKINNCTKSEKMQRRRLGELEDLKKELRETQIEVKKLTNRLTRREDEVKSMKLQIRQKDKDYSALQDKFYKVKELIEFKTGVF